MATVARADVIPVTGATRRASAGLWTNAWYSLRRDRLTMGAAAVLLLLALSAIGAPLFAQYVFHTSFEEQDLLRIYAKPTFDPPAYMLGADEIGRSQVVRLLYGGQVSLFIGFVAAFMNLTLGVGLGLLAGYMRGAVDDLITWFITTLNSIPIIFLLLLITSLFQPGALTLTLIIGVLFWTGVTNFVRGQTFALRDREFATVARTMRAAAHPASFSRRRGWCSGRAPSPAALPRPRLRRRPRAEPCALRSPRRRRRWIPGPTRPRSSRPARSSRLSSTSIRPHRGSVPASHRRGSWRTTARHGRSHFARVSYSMMEAPSTRPPSSRASSAEERRTPIARFSATLPRS